MEWNADSASISTIRDGILPFAVLELASGRYHAAPYMSVIVKLTVIPAARNAVRWDHLV